MRTTPGRDSSVPMRTTPPLLAVTGRRRHTEAMAALAAVPQQDGSRAAPLQPEAAAAETASSGRQAAPAGRAFRSQHQQWGSCCKLHWYLTQRCPATRLPELAIDTDPPERKALYR